MTAAWFLGDEHQRQVVGRAVSMEQALAFRLENFT